MKAINLEFTKETAEILRNANLLPYDFDVWISQLSWSHYPRSTNDRSGVIQPAFLKNLYPLPEYSPNFSKSLEQIILEQCSLLIAEGKHIFMHWSGGIDSTSVLLGLIECGVKKTDLTICCNNASQQEYPKLYERLINEGYELRSKGDQRVFQTFVDEDGIQVSGACGDLLFLPIPSYLFKRFSNQENPFKMNWKDALDSDLQAKFDVRNTKQIITDEIRQNLKHRDLEVPEKIVAACPFEIHNFWQYRWWIINNFRYQDFVLCGSVDLPKDQFLKYIDTNRTPLGCNDAQIWSMIHVQERIPEDITEVWIKKPLKDIIQKWYPDDDYYNNKPSVGSLGGSFRNFGRYEDGTQLSIGYESEMIKRLSEEITR